MERIAIGERPNWVEDANAAEFNIHHIDGELYWDERNAYKFSLAEIEDNIEAPTNELIWRCYDAVDYVVNVKPELMEKLSIPADMRSAVQASWNSGDKDIYGRFDFSYDGKSPAKMLEFNADTPTSLYESAVYQWRWKEACQALGKLPKDADQFNSIHERLIDVFKKLDLPHKTFHFAGEVEMPEDYMTLVYLADCAFQAGYEVHIFNTKDIGISTDGLSYTDLKDQRIRNLFKLYPLEMMFREEFAGTLKTVDTNIFEPLWKSILSNKGILPILWELFPNHPNLLESYFEGEGSFHADWVRKPILSREGANVTLNTLGLCATSEGDYGAEGYIIQKAAILPKFGDDYALIGSWVIAGEAAGIGIRESVSPITANQSRFVPHFIHG